jgi:hypothetical protein
MVRDSCRSFGASCSLRTFLTTTSRSWLLHIGPSDLRMQIAALQLCRSLRELVFNWRRELTLLPRVDENHRIAGVRFLAGRTAS